MQGLVKSEGCRKDTSFAVCAAPHRRRTRLCIAQMHIIPRIGYPISNAAVAEANPRRGKHKRSVCS